MARRLGGSGGQLRLRPLLHFSRFSARFQRAQPVDLRSHTRQLAVHLRHFGRLYRCLCILGQPGGSFLRDGHLQTRAHSTHGARDDGRPARRGVLYARYRALVSMRYAISCWTFECAQRPAAAVCRRSVRRRNPQLRQQLKVQPVHGQHGRRPGEVGRLQGVSSWENSGGRYVTSCDDRIIF